MLDNFDWDVNKWFSAKKFWPTDARGRFSLRRKFRALSAAAKQIHLSESQLE